MSAWGDAGTFLAGVAAAATTVLATANRVRLRRIHREQSTSEQIDTLTEQVRLLAEQEDFTQRLVSYNIHDTNNFLHQTRNINDVLDRHRGHPPEDHGRGGGGW